MKHTIGVSVCIFTYNYEKFLNQAIDSVLAQETGFPVEIVIGDDCSTDATRSVAAAYRDRYPDRIVLSFNETNIGGTRNWIKTINRCSGKYIALLDGDDYFTDNRKLQKLYDALEGNPDYVLGFHGVEEKYDDITGKDKIVVYDKEEYDLSDFLRQGWFIRTGATFFRNDILPKEPPAWVFDFPYRYDTILHVFLCMHGKAVCLKDVMSVWRKHSKGMSFVLLENRVRNGLAEIRLARQLNEYTGKKYSRAARSYMAESYTYLFLNILKSKKMFQYGTILTASLLRMNYKLFFRLFRQKLAA
ncbi:MAG TPA: glycosyltransferase [Puia sp.]|jgi:glycosyltransferase involved in cell wall biosynthesis|nr:glycosyltransferase [Puia sp.]